MLWKGAGKQQAATLSWLPHALIFPGGCIGLSIKASWVPRIPTSLEPFPLRTGWSSSPTCGLEELGYFKGFIHFYFMCECLQEWYEYYLWTWCLQRSGDGIHCLGTGDKGVVEHWEGMLGSKPVSPVKAASALNCWVITTRTSTWIFVVTTRKGWHEYLAGKSKNSAKYLAMQRAISHSGNKKSLKQKCH